eukprot:TRINITY_DN3140_c0_g1_i1.p1 TRINITY_DN3140_c0_g1~~TRINITY_DN3140_c0_g1_i1.p1  ORF type:complete len:591 (-),score=64.58 TRINITY_DN3140_c0_g1_i1:312-2084(-)
MKATDSLLPSTNDADWSMSFLSSSSRRRTSTNVIALWRAFARKFFVTRTVLLFGAFIVVAVVLVPPFAFPDDLASRFSWPLNRGTSDIALHMGPDASGPPATNWSLPPPIHNIYKMTRDSPEVPHILERDWTRPHIFLHYARPHPLDRTTAELFIFASGVTLGDFKRDINVVGCLVGQHVYPAEWIRSDVFSCQVPLPIQGGSLISVVIPHSDKLRSQVQHTVKLAPHLNASIHEQDLIPVPSGTHLHLDRSYESLLYVSSEERFEALHDDWDPDADDSRPRFEVCAGTQIKPFTQYLDDWIAYYTRIGVDMVFVVDNDAPVDLSKKYKGRHDVQVLYWPWRRSQVEGLTFITLAARPRCEWILIADVDEMPMLGMGKNNELAGKQPLSGYLRRQLNSEYKQFQFPYLVMGSSGLVRTPPDPLPEVYVHMADHHDAQNGKSVARTDHWWRYTNLHMFGGIPSAIAPTDWNVSRNYYPVQQDDQAITVHFHHRAFEDMILKQRYGSANTDGQAGPRPDLELPAEIPDWVTKIDDSKKYTYFRDIYRAVMSQPFEFKYTLVRKSHGKRCMARLHTFGERRGMIEEEYGCGSS